MPKVKIIYNREGCIGAGACCLACPKYWQMNPDGKADLLGSKANLEKPGIYELEGEVSEEDLKCLQGSAIACPVQVIEVIEE